MNYLVKPIETAIENGYAFDLRMAMAMDILKSHPLVAAIPDGEDSAGRQKLRLQTAEESVERALDMAEHLVAICEQRGWLCEYDPEMAKELLIRVKTATVTADNLAYEANSERRKKIKEPA